MFAKKLNFYLEERGALCFSINKSGLSNKIHKYFGKSVLKIISEHLKILIEQLSLICWPDNNNV